MTSSQGLLKASGLAEIYYSTEDKKLQELGWSSNTNEGNYSQTTLIGNWSENSFDVKEMSKRKPLPSQVHATNNYEVIIDLITFKV